MQLAEVRSINAAMLDELRAIADGHPEIDVAGALRQVGIQLPSAPLGRRGSSGSRTPSQASSYAASDVSSSKSKVMSPLN